MFLVNINPLSTKGFLLYGGILLIILGLAGMVFLGPTPETSLLGTANWFDQAENIAHLLLGIVALLAYFLLNDETRRKHLILLVGIIAAIVTIAGLVNTSTPAPNVGISNLEMTDNFLHSAVAVWAFVTSFLRKKMREEESENENKK